MLKKITILLIVIYPLTIFGQYKSKIGTDEEVLAKLNATCNSCTPIDSIGFFSNAYMHLIGKIGTSAATIDINAKQCFLFCDSLKAMQGFTKNINSGVILLVSDDWIFTGGNKYINKIYLLQQKDKSFEGLAIDEVTHSIQHCSFNEAYNNGSLKFSKSIFSYKNIYKKFPVELSGNIIFADTIYKNALQINRLLLNKYDVLGLNYKEETNSIFFKNIEYLKNIVHYKEYAITKFKRIYEKVITGDFLEEARASGHTDIFYNGIEENVICNDGAKLIIEVKGHYADGDAYPYYETFLFCYNMVKGKVETYSQWESSIDDTTEEKIKQEAMQKLKANNLADTTDLGDDWFLTNPTVAFKVNNGYVLVKKGGNHGIHSFYKYYPAYIVKDFFRE